MRYINKSLLLLALVAFALPTMAAMRSVPMIEPSPVAIPADLPAALVAKAIKLSLVDRKWIVSRDEPGYIEGTLNVRQHMLKMGFSYDAQQVTIKYVDSAELGYSMKGNQRLIHPKFHNWTNNVVSDLQAQLLHQSIDR